MGRAAKRLEMIARVIRDRGYYPMGPSDAEAIEVVLAKLAGVEVAPAADDEIVEIARAFAQAGWRLERA